MSSCVEQKITPLLHVQRARCADYLGTLLRDLGRFDEAETAYKSVSELLEPSCQECCRTR